MTFHVAAEFQGLFREIGFDGETVFSDPAIKAWRTLPDRENCLWDVPRPDGSILRMHVKRYPTNSSGVDPADVEARAYRKLNSADIPSAQLMGWGKLDDGRSFIILKDLTGYSAADKLIESGMPFERLLIPTAHLAAQLHDAGLHHRDLYLCHFFVRSGCEQGQIPGMTPTLPSPGVPGEGESAGLFRNLPIEGAPTDVRLIDAARVARLPRLFKRRWIVKDLAQFWYSTIGLPITDAQRDAWLREYAKHRKVEHQLASIRRAIVRKSNWIAAHDRRLREKQPARNISIPQK